MSLFGLNIVSHRFALSVKYVFTVEKTAIRKRRRGWRVIKTKVETPCAYQVGGTIYAHPEIIQKLKRESSLYCEKGIDAACDSVF